MYIRKSHIESYSFCPLQFKKQYIDKTEQKKSYALTLGSRFHEFADKFFVAVDILKYSPDRWTEFIPQEFGILERRMASYFINYEINRFYSDELFFPYVTELEFTNHILETTGTIDRIDALLYGGFRLVEYKTSKKFDRKSEKRQLEFYAYNIKNILDIDITELRVINPRLQQYVDYGYPDTSKVETAIQDMKAIINNPDAEIKPRCSWAMYPICGLCSSTQEAGLFKDVPNPLTLR
ncbi:MAG: PD-(D/E)XK nuclease family protein [Proteobacteria bacterium]|jgi:CRISPR/Cas system-associated exonuclease Cas4 (RecB family)|nr:PD-(D/E)XK nuclease family protein [Pseudomonadota bacterium]